MQEIVGLLKRVGSVVWCSKSRNCEELTDTRPFDLRIKPGTSHNDGLPALERKSLATRQRASDSRQRLKDKGTNKARQ